MLKMRFSIPDLTGRAMPRSIVGWFAACWCDFLLGSIVVGALLLSLYSQLTTELLRRATAAVAQDCNAIASHYQPYLKIETGDPGGRPGSDLVSGITAAARAALRSMPGVEGGIWRSAQGSLAYAFPTYEGTGKKTDLPPAEEPSIREAAETAALSGTYFERRREGRSQTLLL
ncbi:MAG: hypothetical protein J2P49_09900, partial [Methylocapsa sp.]|nr:hypothetical protein [Methylocapsa sp.]